MDFSIFQDTDIGGRASNQDRMGYCFTQDSLLMIVADGMGGHPGGEVAAQLSMAKAAAMFQQAAQPRLPDPDGFLHQALLAGHRELHRHQELHGLADVPRTTIVACVIQDERAWWAHVGDSRLYLMRRGHLLARTRDHSKVETLVRLGLITEEQAATHPERNKVLNCLGSPFDPTIEVQSRVPLRTGDVILLCSDGFWSGVDEAAIARALDEEPAAQAVPRLVRQAVDRQGALADNTTALAVQWHVPAAVEDQALPTPAASASAIPTLPAETFAAQASPAGPPVSPSPHRDMPAETIAIGDDHAPQPDPGGPARNQPATFPSHDD